MAVYKNTAEMMIRNEEKERLLAEIDPIYKSLVAASMDHIKNRLAQEIAPQIKDLSEITRRIGDPGVKQIQLLFQDGAYRMDRLLPMMFDSYGVSLYKTIASGKYSVQADQIAIQIRTGIDMALRKLMAIAGMLLAKSRFAKVPSFWRQGDGFQGRTLLNRGLLLTNPLEQNIDVFINKTTEIHACVCRLNDLKNAKG